MTETETSAGEAVAGDGVDDLVNEVLKCFMHREYVRIQLKDDQTMNEASNPHRRAAASFNKQMHRTAAPRCSFESAGLFGRWIRSQRPFPAVVGDLDRSATAPA